MTKVIVLFILAIICLIISYVSFHLLLTRIEMREMGIEKRKKNKHEDKGETNGQNN